jgi:hypothetical protein
MTTENLIRIETLPWNHGRPGLNGMKVVGFDGEKQICTLWVSDFKELPDYFRVIEIGTGKQVSFDWSV